MTPRPRAETALETSPRIIDVPIKFELRNFFIRWKIKKIPRLQLREKVRAVRKSKILWSSFLFTAEKKVERIIPTKIR